MSDEEIILTDAEWNKYQILIMNLEATNDILLISIYREIIDELLEKSKRRIMEGVNNV